MLMTVGREVRPSRAAAADWAGFIRAVAWFEVGVRQRRCSAGTQKAATAALNAISGALGSAIEPALDRAQPPKSFTLNDKVGRGEIQFFAPPPEGHFGNVAAISPGGFGIKQRIAELLLGDFFLSQAATPEGDRSATFVTILSCG
jgi:hypothetical protein